MLKNVTIFKYLLVGLILLMPSSSLSEIRTTEGKNSDVFTMTNNYQVGLANQFIIGIKLDKGYRFNDKYPASVRILKKPRLIKTFGIYEKDHFYKERDYILVLVPFTPLKSGFELVKINMRYSVCDATSCIVENIDYSIELEINE